MCKEVFCLQGKLDFTTESRTYPPDDLPLLTAWLRLPRWDGTGGARFDRFYRAYAHAFFSYCQGVLLPQAQSALVSARQNGGALPEWVIRLDTTVTLLQGDLLSLYTDTAEQCGGRRLLLRRSETWTLSDGSLLSIDSLFPGGKSWRRQLLCAAADQIRQQQEQGISCYHPDWQHRLRASFKADRFYLTEQGLSFFYQMYAIAPAAEGIPVFTLLWDKDHGPRLPE